MARGKLKVAYIENHSRRKVCYKKRKTGLLKKVEELSTLCGVDACAIIYNPFEEEPLIWPPSHSAVQGVLQKFKDQPVVEKNRNKMDHEGFIKRRINKLQEQLKKLKNENRQKEIKCFVSQCLAGEARQNFNLADLNEMRWSIHFSLQSISRRIETTKTQLPPLAPPVMVPAIQSTGRVVMPTVQTTNEAVGDFGMLN